MGLAEHLARLDAGPRGEQVGAFFDLDGTLVAGFTANAFFTDQVRRRQVGVFDAAKTLLAVVDGTYLGGDPLKGGDRAVAAVAGQTEDTLADLGERLFVQKIARTIRREARELVRAHQRLGHTVVVSSAATAYQVRPVARDLGIEHLVCTELEVGDDGVLTGAVRGRMRWGREKANGVRSFARAHGVDLRASYGYGNGVEDIDFLAAVGNPVALSPDPGLRRAATRFGWPILQLRDPLGGDLLSAARTVAALGGMNAGALTGLALAAATGDRSQGRRTGVALACQTALRLAGVHLRVVGAEHLDQARPAVVVANHQSAIDPVVVGSLLDGDFTVVAKQEARWDPRAILGSVLLDPAFIDRGNSEQARATLDAVAARIRGGTSLLIFPEGTRSPSPRLGPFRKGAFHLAVQAGVPVLPVVLRNTGEVLPRHSKVIRSGVIDVCVLAPVTGWTVPTMTEQVTALHAAFEATLTDWPGDDPAYRGSGQGSDDA